MVVSLMILKMMRKRRLVEGVNTHLRRKLFLPKFFAR
jgi:hypothetical protein